MEQEVKLLIGTSLQGVDKQFYIYRNSKLGEGGFGVVRRACEANRQGHPLAVKIIPYGGDELKRAKIEREIAILRILPDHENLVRVLPYKCFSENNFYIFMELCEEGTLSQVVRKPGLLQEQTIFSIFYQLLSGYKILWQAKIVHQDLKLANILAKKGVLKITDFGFSILAEKYVTSLTRQGTLPYMPFEKLTDPNYIADQLSDIYSLGVIMFEAITKMHPYVNQKSIKTQKEYVAALKAANIARPKLYSTYSLQLQTLFEIVAKMCAKLRKNRIGCKQLYQYLDNEQFFQHYREKKAEPSVQLQLPHLPIKIEEISMPIFLPFVIPPENQSLYIKKLQAQKENRVNDQNKKTIQKVKGWLLGQRLILYFFDRLARRLIVQKLKLKLSGENALIYNKAILTCLVFEKRVARDIMRQLKYPQKFRLEEIELFKGSQDGRHCVRLVRRDQEYTQQSINDHLKRTVQIQVKDQKELIDLAEKKELAAFIQKGHKNIKECAEKISINISDKLQLVTLTYLLDSLKLITSSNEVDGLTYEKYFYETETQPTSQLIQRVMAEVETRNLQKPMFMFGQEQEDELI